MVLPGCVRRLTCYGNTQVSWVLLVIQLSLATGWDLCHCWVPGFEIVTVCSTITSDLL